MRSHDQYLDLIHEGVRALQMPARPRGLYDPIRYTLEGGGKRLRPTLLLAVADALGRAPEEVLNQALAIEMFHNFTLLHDDVMDHAALRRGRPTVHMKWDVNTAILSGDAMLTIASRLMGRGAGEHLPAVLDLFNETALEVYEGQQLDMDFEDEHRVTVDDYMEMIRLKTSVLLACACKLGAIMAGAAEEDANAFYAFGLNLGLAFQLRDDYLDTFGDPAIFGKDIGGDILNEKKTWFLINALLHHGPKLLKVEDANEDEKIKRIRGVYLEMGLDKRCHDLIDRYIEQACAALPSTLPGSARSFFTDLAHSSSVRSN